MIRHHRRANDRHYSHQTQAQTTHLSFTCAYADSDSGQTSNGWIPRQRQPSPENSSLISKVTSRVPTIATSLRSDRAAVFTLSVDQIDRRFSESNSAFVLFGQDWSPFVSSTLPNTVENTNFGGVGYGAAYTRIPQAKFGFNHKFGGSRDLQFQPEIAIVLPAFGNLPSDVAISWRLVNDRERIQQQPGIQGRAVLQWQLDKSANVAPAQLIFSFHTRVAPRSLLPRMCLLDLDLRFHGAEVSSDSNGYSAEFQLPTHFVTVVGKYYGGSDLVFSRGTITLQLQRRRRIDEHGDCDFDRWRLDRCLRTGQWYSGSCTAASGACSGRIYPTRLSVIANLRCGSERTQRRLDRVSLLRWRPGACTRCATIWHTWRPE